MQPGYGGTFTQRVTSNNHRLAPQGGGADGPPRARSNGALTRRFIFLHIQQFTITSPARAAKINPQPTRRASLVGRVNVGVWPGFQFLDLLDVVSEILF